MSTIQELRSKVFDISQELDEAEKRFEHTRLAYRSAMTEYSNAVALDKYGFSIGDIIEFTKKSWRKTETVRMKITRFSASVVGRDPGSDDAFPSIHGVRVLKDGTIGTKSEYCFPSSDDYSNIHKAQP
jgi:hypothetical protein